MKRIIALALSAVMMLSMFTACSENGTTVDTNSKSADIVVIGAGGAGMTAAILGGVSFGGGNGNLAGVFVGLLILNTFSKGMVAIGSSSYWTTILTGVLLLVALIIDSYAMQKARKAVK